MYLFTVDLLTFWYCVTVAYPLLESQVIHHDKSALEQIFSLTKIKMTNLSIFYYFSMTNVSKMTNLSMLAMK